MKKMFNLKTIILTTTFAVSLILFSTTTTQAALQANPTTHQSPVKKVGSAWITQIRQMETSGQTMGLDETLDGLNATEENGIDVHMMLPTEYGAVAILSTSGYGNQGKLRDETNVQKRTTTGNATGVYFTGDRWEMLAMTDAIPTSKYSNPSAGGLIFPNIGPWWHEGSYSESICGSSQDGRWRGSPTLVGGGRKRYF